MGGKPRQQPDELVIGVWPVAIHRGLEPTISDGYKPTAVVDANGKKLRRQHLGVDIMFRRPAKGAEHRPQLTRWYQCPTGVVLAIACAPGTVTRIVRSPKHGGAVYVDHGRYLSVYRHLAAIDVAVGQEVAMGQGLGIVGHAPSAGQRGINHLHFEVWDTQLQGRRWSRRMKAVDPGPFLRRWRKVEA